MSQRLLIIGGYGVFGGRLAQLLSDEPRLTLVIAGRSLPRARAFCANLSGRAGCEPALFDRDKPLADQLKAVRPDIVVDASGPFQAYGAACYDLIESAIEYGADYLDLTDAAAFVRGVTRFDTRARERGVTVLTGVSSFPVLTAAVVRHLSADLAAISAIRAGVAPSPHAVVGPNVIRAISSYAGRAVHIRRDGRSAVGYPLTETMRYTIATPGALPLPDTLFSLVEVPDLTLLADIYPEVETVWVGAGPRPEILHRALIGLSFLVRWRIVSSLAPLSGLFWAVNRRLRWGAHRGGMFVEIAGRRHDGENVRRSWHLNAEGDDGPFIPSMAVEALIRKHLDGERLEPGARSAAGTLTLADYARVFAGRTFSHGLRDETAMANAPLYRRVLGDQFTRLAPSLRAMHDLREGGHTVHGKVSVERGKGMPARILAHLIGFPPQAAEVPVTVRFSLKGASEIWERDFNGRRFRSIQSEGKGRQAHLVEERFGPLTFGLALVFENEKLRLVVRKWRFFGMPMPQFLAPGGDTFEFEKDGRFHFNVEITHPLLGLIVRYRGWLAPETASNL